MKPPAVSSKWIVSTLVSVAVVIVGAITQAQADGADIPAILVTIAGVLGPILTYLKPENRPSSSAIEAAAKY